MRSSTWSRSGSPSCRRNTAWIRAAPARIAAKSVAGGVPGHLICARHPARDRCPLAAGATARMKALLTVFSYLLALLPLRAATRGKATPTPTPGAARPVNAAPRRRPRPPPPRNPRSKRDAADASDLRARSAMPMTRRRPARNAMPRGPAEAAPSARASEEDRENPTAGKEASRRMHGQADREAPPSRRSAVREAGGESCRHRYAPPKPRRRISRPPI